MKRRKGWIFLALMMIMAGMLSFRPAQAEAKAKPKLSAKKVSVKVKRTKKIKVKNARKKKVQWSIPKASKKNIKIVKKTRTYVKIKGVKKGKATVKANVGGKTLKCRVTVKKAKKKYFPEYLKKVFDVSKSGCVAGESVDVVRKWALFSYTEITKSEKARLLKFKSSKPSVFSINKYGMGKAKKAGKAKITVKAKKKSGWISDSLTVKVFPADVWKNVKISFSSSGTHYEEGQKLIQMNMKVTNDTDFALHMKAELWSPKYFIDDIYWIDGGWPEKWFKIRAHSSKTIRFSYVIGDADGQSTSEKIKPLPASEIPDRAVIRFELGNKAKAIKEITKYLPKLPHN